MQRCFVRKSFGVVLPLFILIVFALTASAQNMFRKITDFDGDGKTDLAIWRSGSPQSYYWVYGSRSGISVFAWGLSGDSPVRY